MRTLTYRLLPTSPAPPRPCSASRSAAQVTKRRLERINALLSARGVGEVSTYCAASLLAILLLVSSCDAVPQGGGRGAVESSTPYTIDHPALPNLLHASRQIYCGGEPKQRDSFAELARLGIRTIVSVDVAQPRVHAARRHGLRYVHIPIGYDGVDEHARRSIARLVRDAEAPLYVHCHHGLHRAPAAAAVAAVTIGDTSRDDAVEILRLAGTSRDYVGLWRAVRSYEPTFDNRDLPELVEVAEVDTAAAAMGLVDRAYANLVICRDARWATPKTHPDLVPAHEALLLWEGLYESRRALTDVATSEMRTWLTGAEKSARDLEAALKRGDKASATTAFETLGVSCHQCHKEYRD